MVSTENRLYQNNSCATSNSPILILAVETTVVPRKTLIRFMQVQPDKILPGARAGYLSLPTGGLLTSVMLSHYISPDSQNSCLGEKHKFQRC